VKGESVIRTLVTAAQNQNSAVWSAFRQLAGRLHLPRDYIAERIADAMNRVTPQQADWLRANVFKR
jgi:hypothetical protein